LRPHLRLLIKTALGCLALIAAAPLVGAADVGSVVVSIPEQRMYLFDSAGEKIAAYRVSTSQYGTGDSRGSYATPLGQLAVAAKVGGDAPVGTVFKGLHRTGEICKVNARGRDPIVTRIIHLRGLEKGNASAYGRRIYIHGTPDERHIGRPVSYGCIRMKSRDVIAVYDAIGLGTRVEITDERVGGGLFAKTTRPPAPIGAGPAKSDPAPKLVASATVPRTGAKAVAISAKAPPPPAVKNDRRDSSVVRLLESSGLTISFGGGEASDRPR
jgi:L,D-transpeptidase catalytic domain